MMTNAKPNKPRSARTLANILATRIAVLIVVILAIFASVSVYYSYTAYRQTLTAQQQQIAQNASQTVSNFVLGKFSRLETAVGLVNPIVANAETQENLMESLLGEDPSFRQFVLLNSRGQKLAQVARVSQTSQFIAQVNSNLLSQTSTGQNYTSPVYIDDSTSEPLLAIAIPVKNVFGDLQGTLVGEINLKFIWDLVEQIKVGQTGYAYVVDNQGNLIAFRDTARVLANENVKQIGEVQKFVDNPSSTADVTPNIASYTGLLGSAVMGTYLPLGTPQWAVVIELPAAEANQPLWQLILVNATAVLSFTVLGALTGILLARLLTAPLVALSHSATEIANGDLSVEAQTSGPAEVGQLASAFNTMTARLRELIGSLEQRVSERTKALSTSSEVSRRISTILNQKELVSEVVNQVKNAFGYYHAQIYFYDAEGENLVMAGGTGEAGEKMLAQHHKVSKGRGLVGRAAERNQPILVSNTALNSEWLPNVLLPDTESEVAIPISIGDQVLGVLDIQHNIADGLQQEDVDSLKSIANQVAVAYQNIQSTAIVAKRAAELQTVATISTAASTIKDVQQMLETVVHLTQRQFGLYHAHVFTYNEDEKKLKIVACGYKEGDEHEGTHGTTTIPIAQEQSLVARAARTKRAVIVNDVRSDPGWLPNPLLPDTASELAVPMIVGNELLGVLDVQSDRLNAFTEEDASIQSTLAAQIATSLQNANTLLKLQRQAEYETTINLITHKIQSSATVENALQVAARELGHALGKRSTLVTLETTALASEKRVVADESAQKPA